MQSKLFSLFLVGLMLIASPNAHAKFAAAAQTGWGFVSGNGTDSGMSSGLSFDYSPVENFSFGAFTNAQFTNFDFTALSYVSLLGLRGNWQAKVPGFYVGPTLALASSVVVTEDIRDSSGGFALGGQIGYDFEISKIFGIGAEARYLRLFGNLEGNVFQFLANFKFWFGK